VTFGLAVIRLKPRTVLNRTENMAGGEAILERLTHPEVADFLIRGARFIKWDEVGRNVFYYILAGRILLVTLYKLYLSGVRFDLHFSMRIGNF